MGVATQNRVPPGAGPIRVMDPGPALTPTERDLLERDLLDVQRVCVTAGLTFDRLVNAMLCEIGAVALSSRVAFGVPVCAQGHTRSGRPFAILKAGTLSLDGRRGMSSAERFWVTLGKASALRVLSVPGTLIVVATTNAVPSSAALRKALAVVVGPGLPFDAVCDLTAEGGVRSWLGVLAE